MTTPDKPPLNKSAMTPLQFLKHLGQRCGEVIDKGDSSPAGMMVNGRNTGFMEVQSYISEYLRESGNG